MTPSTKLAPGHVADDAQDKVAGGSLDSDHHEGDAQEVRVAVTPGQWTNDAHDRPAGGPLQNDHARPDDLAEGVVLTVVGEQPAGQVSRDAQAGHADAELLFHAEFLNDIERLRIATENRIRSAEQGDPKNDVPPRPEFADAGRPALEALKQLEHAATLNLQRAMRRHPLGKWVKQTVGVGEKQGARLLAAIGDPYWNHAAGRPRRGPAELWAYCGFRPDQKKRRGERAAWNHDAKMRARLIAESCIKQAHSPYRGVYDRERAKWADRETSDGHKHAHALRVVAKEILKDIYKESAR